MAIVTESSLCSSSVAMMTPEKRTSRISTNTETRRTVGRSRRRRPAAASASASASISATDIIDQPNEKENENDRCHHSRRRTNATSTTPMRRSRKSNLNSAHGGDDDGVRFGSFGVEKAVSSSSNFASTRPQYDHNHDLETAVRDFRKSLQRLSVPSGLWNDFPELAHTLVSTSLSKSSTPDSLGLDGHASALLSFCRKLIKEVSADAGGGGKSKQPKVSLDDNLLVAVHILRSMAFVLADAESVERKEALLKMFFHLIASSSSDRGRDKNNERCKWIAFAGYEGLAKVLSTYSVHQNLRDGKDRIVSFQLLRTESDASAGAAPSNPKILFAIPSTTRRKKTNSVASSPKAGNMSIRQLSTIAFQTTMLVLKEILSLRDGTPLPYGNLGSMVLGKVESGSETQMCHCHRVALELLEQIHGPWLVMLASASIHERDAVKEVLSYLKGIHRLLWDAASTLKSSSNSDSAANNAAIQPVELERECLELRKQAILHLLARTGLLKLDALVRKTSFESGCTYAWKAGSVFAQHLASDSTAIGKSLLSNFYEDLDSAFARLMATNPIVSLGFVEYRMHRSLHLGATINQRIPSDSKFDEADLEEDEISNGNYRVLLHILEVGISSKMRIQSSISKTQSQRQILSGENQHLTSASISLLETFVLAFNRQVIHRLDQIPSDATNQILKLICNLSLHKTLFLAMKHHDSEESSSIISFAQLETEFLVATTILTECLGPLVWAFLNRNPQKGPQLVDLMVECFLRPLSLHEQLSESHSSIEDGANVPNVRRHLESSLHICKQITEIFINDSHRPNNLVLPIHCLEKAAKSLYAIARQRNERSRIEDSIPPLLYSLKLYDKLDSLNGRKKDYQLSSRLFLLSNTLQSMDKIHESFSVCCLLMKYESEKQYSTIVAEVTKEQQLLNYLSAKSCGLLPPAPDDAPPLSQIIRSLCRQMAATLIQIEAHDEQEALSMHNPFAVGSVMESFLEEFTGDAAITVRAAPHPLDSIQRLLDFDSRSANHETKFLRVHAVTEMLVQLGRSIQQLSRDSDVHERRFNFQTALHNYFYLHSLLQQSIADLGLDFPLIFHGLLGLVAAASIVPTFSIARTADFSDWEKGVDPLLVEAAMEITNESIGNLELQENYDDEMAWGLLSESLRIVLRNLLAMLQRKTTDMSCDDNLLNDCVSVAQRIAGAENTSDGVLRASNWAIWVVTYLRNESEIRGDHDRSAVLSLWSLSLAKKIDPHQPWFRALTMTVSTKDGNVLHLKRSLVASSLQVLAPQGSMHWIFEKEFELCELRITALQSVANDRDSFRTQMQRVEDIRAELVEFMVEKSHNLFVLNTWVLSTVYLVQTDIAMVFGCYPTALKTSQMCQKRCQTILKRISFGVANFDDWMSAIATSNVLAMAAQRYIEILSRRPKLHYRLGDHRKALAYTRSILEYLNIDPVLLTSREGQGYAPKDLTESLKAAPQTRLFLQMNSWASAPETTIQKFSDIQALDLNRHCSNDSDQTNSSIVHSIQDIIAIGDILCGDSSSKRFQQKCYVFYQEAATLMQEITNKFQVKALRVPLDVEQNLGMPVADQVKLRNVRRLLESSHELNRGSETTIRRLCAQIEKSEFSCSEDKAWSLYYLGVLELEAARCSGVLQKLWNEHECDQTSSSSASNDENILSSRHYLSKALLYSLEASDIFARNILRSLALVEGPKINNGIGSSAGILILRSIGQSTRRRLTWSFDQDYESIEGESLSNLKDIFGVFDGLHTLDQERDDKINHFLTELAARTPENWGFVAPVICPSGEMLVSIIQKTNPNPNEFTITTKCIFPPRGENAYDIIMKPLDIILARVQEQLQGVDPSLVSKSDDKEAIKRKWWDERNQLDAEMCGLLEDVESLYFSKIFDFGSNEDSSVTPNSCNDIEEFPCGDLTSRFKSAANDDNEVRRDPEEEHQEKIDILKKLTIPKLKDRLLSAGASKSQFRKLRKDDLIDLLIQTEYDSKESDREEDDVDTEDCNTSDTSNDCLFLILDENLHRFPFEGMAVMKGKTVCRIPCLSFVLATLLEHSGGPEPFPSVNPASVSYILNPENNLQATQDRLLPAIQGLSSSHKWDWDGVIGEIPPHSYFSEAFCKKDGLMMYFGHGGAQVCFSRRRVEELIEHRPSDIPLYAPINETNKTSCRATVLLMGCSSGKLVSINRKQSKSIEETPLYYEPEGVALSYLCAGAPCVIGNLWDVTDNDIDRFSISLLENFFDSDQKSSDDPRGTMSRCSLAKSLSISRSVCKLKHLVGCAPVCYGVPVYLQ